MSVYSESGSVICLGGKEFNFEQGVDEVISKVQSNLNDCQYNLRRLLMCSDKGEPFIEECNIASTVEDNLIDIHALFLDLLDVCGQIISIPIDKEDKEYFKQYKKQRKEHKKQRLKELEQLKKQEITDRKSNKMDDVME